MTLWEILLWPLVQQLYTSIHHTQSDIQVIAKFMRLAEVLVFIIICSNIQGELISLNFVVSGAPLSTAMQATLLDDREYFAHVIM